MTRQQRLILIVTLALVVPVAGYFYVTRRYLKPKHELEEDIEARRAWVEQAQRYLDTRRAIERDLASFAGRTLGRTEEEVEHALRAALNELGERCGLARLTVDTNMRGAVGSPAVAARVSDFQKDKSLRDRIDFFRAEATVTGTGSLERVLAAVHAAESLPWLSRLDAVDVSARDNGARFELRLKLTTLYFHDLAPAGELAARLPEPGPLPESVRALAARNVFHLPPPPATPEPAVQVAAQQPEPTPAPPPPPPYADWQVTGITATGSGPELWLTNRRTNERRVLGVAQRILDATFIGVDGDPQHAVVEIDGERFLIELGKSLAERTPLENVSVTESAGGDARTSTAAWAAARARDTDFVHSRAEGASA